MTEAWIVAFGIVALSTIVGILLFAIVFSKSDRLRRIRTSLLLINLAVTDLIVGAVAIPMYMTFSWPGADSAASNAFLLSYAMIDMLSGLVSLFGLAAIALERDYSVYWPHKHHTLSKTKYYVAMVKTWSLATLQVILRILQSNHVILLPRVLVDIRRVIIVSYIAVWKNMKANRKPRSFYEMKAEREKKLAKTLEVLTSTFLITWLPFHAVNTVFNLCPTHFWRKDFIHLVYGVKLLHYSNSLVNPVIYSFRFPEVRLTLARIFCRRGQAIMTSDICTAGMRGRNSAINLFHNHA